MNLDGDLQRILNIGAKVYNIKTKRQGKVHSNNQVDVMVDYGKGDYKTYPIDEFTSLLTSDVIVSNSRVTMGNGDTFKVKPREVQSVVSELSQVYTKYVHPPEPFIPKVDLSDKLDLETGYINFATSRFSTEPKKGYTKVEFRKATEKVTLELTSEQIEALKEMGLM